MGFDFLELIWLEKAESGAREFAKVPTAACTAPSLGTALRRGLGLDDCVEFAAEEIP
jgi:hypothetical protein